MRFPVAWGASPAGHLLLLIYQRGEEERQRAVMSPWNATWALVTNSAGRRKPDHKHRRLWSWRPIERGFCADVNNRASMFAWSFEGMGHAPKWNVLVYHSVLERVQHPKRFGVFLWMDGEALEIKKEKWTRSSWCHWYGDRTLTDHYSRVCSSLVPPPHPAEADRQTGRAWWTFPFVMWVDWRVTPTSTPHWRGSSYQNTTGKEKRKTSWHLFTDEVTSYRPCVDP